MRSSQHSAATWSGGRTTRPVCSLQPVITNGSGQALANILSCQGIHSPTRPVERSSPFCRELNDNAWIQSAIEEGIEP
jgi:hypothetical protein